MKMRTRVEACSVLVFFFDFFLDLQTFYVFAFQVSLNFWTLWKLQKFCHLRSIGLFETDIKVVTGGPKCPTNCLLIDRISQFLISLLPKIPPKKTFCSTSKIAQISLKLQYWSNPLHFSFDVKILLRWLFLGMFSNLNTCEI